MWIAKENWVLAAALLGLALSGCEATSTTLSDLSAVSDGPSPSPSPSSSAFVFPNVGACTSEAAPTDAVAIFAGSSLPQNWGAYPFSGSVQPNLTDATIPCSPGHKVISYLEPAAQYVGMTINYNGGTAGFPPVASARHVSFDIYVSVAGTVIATSAPYLGEPNDHPWLINTQGIEGAAPYPEAIVYPQGWSHMEFQVPQKPTGNDNVAQIVFEKWTTGVVTIAIDNLFIYY